MGRVTRTAVVLTVVFSAFGPATAPAGAAEDGNDTVSALVAPGSQTDADGAYYVLEVKPGDTVTQTMLVHNERKKALQADIEAVDAFTRDTTGAGYGAPGSTPTGTGSWIVVNTPVLTLQPSEQLPVDFTVHVPTDAKAGQYLAGMSASVPLSVPTTTLPTADNVANVAITLQGQRVIAVQVNVVGPAAPKLAVNGVRPTATPDGLALLIAMANEGNAMTKGTATIRVNSTGLQQTFEIDTFVPGTDIEYRMPWTQEVIPGNHAVAITMRYGGDNQVNWNGTVEINPAAQRQLQSDLDNLRVVDQGSKSATSLFIAIGGIAALLLGGGALAVRRRRRTGVRLAPAVN